MDEAANARVWDLLMSLFIDGWLDELPQIATHALSYTLEPEFYPAVADPLVVQDHDVALLRGLASRLDREMPSTYQELMRLLAAAGLATFGLGSGWSVAEDRPLPEERLGFGELQREQAARRRRERIYAPMAADLDAGLTQLAAGRTELVLTVAEAASAAGLTPATIRACLPLSVDWQPKPLLDDAKADALPDDGSVALEWAPLTWLISTLEATGGAASTTIREVATAIGGEDEVARRALTRLARMHRVDPDPAAVGVDDRVHASLLEL